MCFLKCHVTIFNCKRILNTPTSRKSVWIDEKLTATNNEPANAVNAINALSMTQAQLTYPTNALAGLFIPPTNSPLSSVLLT
ncbi:hypothetical protein Y032_0020g24 [Ancylostoma ceylanicum]|uniref:Uncharacterized protein n=1 Tax=Ancylostoma ceylanicum TaxID=53326 RepID=A0A016V0G6_9BILA|nr:hypothetical protein Y032_0020g24 [Ancylostoma ceylanicum]